MQYAQCQVWKADCSTASTYHVIDNVCNNLNPRYQLQIACSTSFRRLPQPVYALHSTIKGQCFFQSLAY